MARRRNRRGMVTVELAVGLLAAGLACVLACLVINLVVIQTRCGDVAAQLARQLARGDQAQADAVRASAPRGSRIVVTKSGSEVKVSVDLDQRVVRLGTVHLHSHAVAVAEPGTTP